MTGARVCGFCLGIVYPGQDHPCDQLAADVESAERLPVWFDGISYDASTHFVEVKIGGAPYLCTSVELDQLVRLFNLVLDRARQVEDAIDVTSWEVRDPSRRRK